MKIAFLTPEYPHSRTGISGGLGTSIFNLAKGLIAIGHQVSILVYQQREDTVFEDKGITIYQIENIKIKGFSLLLTQRKVQTLINRLYTERKIEIVEAPDWTGFTSFIKLKCPLVIRLHGSDTYFCHLDERSVKIKNEFLEKRALQNADGIISVSQFTAEVTKKLFRLDKKITVTPNSIAVEQFRPGNVRIEPETILYFGTLIRKKGALELAKIFNEVHTGNPRAKLILIGADSGDKQSRSTSTWHMMQELFTSEAFENVTYNGAVPYSEISKHISRATVCIFPTFAEAFPVSWLEAMALEKAIVASNIGWAKELITDGKEGFLEHPKNHQDFAQKINRLLEDKALREFLGKAAREKVLQCFTKEVVAEQSVEFYRKFVK